MIQSASFKSRGGTIQFLTDLVVTVCGDAVEHTLGPSPSSLSTLHQMPYTHTHTHGWFNVCIWMHHNARDLCVVYNLTIRIDEKTSLASF